LIFYAKTYPKIQTGHPFDKTYSVNSSLSEDVFKKCGKQENLIINFIKTSPFLLSKEIHTGINMVYGYATLRRILKLLISLQLIDIV
jgi:hypothetical protein